MPHILIIEDDPLHCQYVTAALDRAGLAVTAVSSTGEALSALQHTAFDCVITDIMMPDLDGIELARRIAAARPGLPIIGMTGAPRPIAAIYHRAMSLHGAQAMLHKPFEPQALVCALEQAGVIEPALSLCACQPTG